MGYEAIDLKSDSNFLTESAKKEYLSEFSSNLKTLMEKSVFKERSLGTKYSFSDVPASDSVGKKTMITLTHKNKTIKFTVEILPWLWTNGSIKVIFNLVDTKNVLVPKKRLGGGKEIVKVWRPGSSRWWFIESFAPIRNYLKALEVTPVDIGLFDTVELAAEKLLEKLV